MQRYYSRTRLISSATSGLGAGLGNPIGGPPGHEPVFAAGVAEREGLIMAVVNAPNVRELYTEYRAADAEIVQTLTKQAWGGTDFIVRDPDGNAIAFVG